MNYTDVFSGRTVPPSGRNYRYITLAGSVIMHWPFNYEGDDFVAGINDVQALLPGLIIKLPDATEVGPGQDMLINNVGTQPFVVQDTTGGAVAVINPGVSKYICLTDNTTQAGVWRVVTFGALTSQADASALAGLGIMASLGKLNAAMAVTVNSSNITITSNDRAKLYVNNGGSTTMTLNPADSYKNNFFFAVRNSGSGSVLLQPQSNEKIDTLASLTLAPGESCFVMTDGAQWYTVGFGRSTQFQFTKLVKDVSAGGTFTLTPAEASAKLLQFTGTPVANVTVIVPAVVNIYYVQNSFNGQRTLTVQTPNGSGVTFNNNDRVILYCDGVNVVSAQSISLGSSVSIVDGSAGAPAINFSSDTDTGIYHSGTGELGIAANGTAVAKFNQDFAWFPGEVRATKFVGTFEGTATGFTGTIGVANGGTGATTAQQALANLGGQPLLNYTPYPANNPNNFISGINYDMVTAALGYVPVGINSAVNVDYGRAWVIYSDANGKNDWSGQIQIREQGLKTGSATVGPRLVMHWGGVTARQISVSRDGWIDILDDTGNGWAGIRAGVVAEMSDERLKKNWHAPEANFLEKLAKIDRYGAFDWNDGGRGFGIGAQSLAAVAPRSVFKDDDGYWSVQHGGVAVVACVELAKRLLALEEKLK